MLTRTLNLRFLGREISDEEATEKFGLLKATLGTIPAVFANDDVRPSTLLK
jgi:hypothetical protein